MENVCQCAAQDEAQLSECPAPHSWRELPFSFASQPALRRALSLPASAASAAATTPLATPPRGTRASRTSGGCWPLAEEEAKPQLPVTPSLPRMPAAHRSPLRQPRPSGMPSPTAHTRGVAAAVTPAAAGRMSTPRSQPCPVAGAGASAASLHASSSPVALASLADEPAADVGMGILLSPQPTAAAACGAGVITPMRRCTSEPRPPPARPRAIPRRLALSPARLLDFECACMQWEKDGDADGRSGSAAREPAHTVPGRARRGGRAHSSRAVRSAEHGELALQVWGAPQPASTAAATALAAADAVAASPPLALAAAMPTRRGAIVPGSRPSHRSCLSPLMAAAAVEETEAAAAAERRSSRHTSRQHREHGGRQRHALRKPLFCEDAENGGAQGKAAAVSRAPRLGGTLLCGEPVKRDPFSAVQQNGQGRVPLPAAAAVCNKEPPGVSWEAEEDEATEDTLFADDMSMSGDSDTGGPGAGGCGSRQRQCQLI